MDTSPRTPPAPAARRGADPQGAARSPAGLLLGAPAPLLLLPLLALYVAAVFLAPPHVHDEGAYVGLAHRLVEGHYTLGNDDALLDEDHTSPDLWFGPGLPLALTPLAALDAPLWAFRLPGALFLFGAVLVFFALVRLRWGRGPALAAASLLGLYPPLLVLLPNVHSEPLGILFLVTALYGLARTAVDRSAAGFALAAGGLAGLALTRVAYGWVLMLALAVLAARWLVTRNALTGRFAAVHAAALILCVPWLAYTASVTGRPLVWGNSGSLSLYWMASPHPGDLGDWRRADDVFTDPRLAPHRPFFETLRGKTLAEQNAALEREALANIRDHPGAYAGNVLANVSRLFFHAPYSEVGASPRILLYAVPNTLVLAAIAVSLATLVRRRGAFPPEGVPMLLLGGGALGLHVLLAAYPRMLMPIVPVVVWFFAWALVADGRVGAALARARRRYAGAAPSRVAS